MPGAAVVLLAGWRRWTIRDRWSRRPGCGSADRWVHDRGGPGGRILLSGRWVRSVAPRSASGQAVGEASSAPGRTLGCGELRRPVARHLAVGGGGSSASRRSHCRGVSSTGARSRRHPAARVQCPRADVAGPTAMAWRRCAGAAARSSRWSARAGHDPGRPWLGAERATGPGSRGRRGRLCSHAGRPGYVHSGRRPGRTALLHAGPGKDRRRPRACRHVAPFTLDRHGRPGDGSRSLRRRCPARRMTT